jgi:hypothetical protein
VAQDPTMSPWVPGFGVFRAAVIADRRGHRGKLCRWGDRGGGWGAMAAGSVALVGRSLPFLRWLTSISTFDSLEPRLGLLTPGG